MKVNHHSLAYKMQAQPNKTYKDLRHRYGMSWKKGEGFFERSGDMVFTLQRRKVGKKIKQCQVIRYRD